MRRAASTIAVRTAGPGLEPEVVIQDRTTADLRQPLANGHLVPIRNERDQQRLPFLFALMSVLLKSGMTAPMTTHTPGPWRPSNDARRVYSGHAFHIADTFGPDQTANARLIAAAPDMLAACKDMLTYIEDYAQSAESDDPVHELLPRYRAAIAKAEGCCAYHRSGGDTILSCGGDIAKAEGTA